MTLLRTLFTFATCTLLALAPTLTPTNALAANTGILVVGGTGQLGSYHVNQLSAAGERIIVLARPSSTFERLEGSTYEVVIADLMDADAVKAAVMDAKPAVIIDVSNVPGIRMEDGDSFYWRSMRTLVAAAQEAGVTQIIRHSARGARQMLTQPAAMFKDQPQIINYLRDVARAEIALETASANSDLEYTIILNSNLPPEPAIPTGNGALVDDLTVDLGITRADLARITTPCILNPACYGKTLNAVDDTLAERQ